MSAARTRAVVDKLWPQAELEVPIRTRSETNMREHWSARHRRRAEQRRAAGLLGRALRLHLYVERAKRPIVVTLARLAPRELDDDNVRGALKAIRDGIADALGVDDRDPRVVWLYRQEKRATYGVRVEVRT